METHSQMILTLFLSAPDDIDPPVFEEEDDDDVEIQDALSGEEDMKGSNESIRRSSTYEQLLLKQMASRNPDAPASVKSDSGCSRRELLSDAYSPGEEKLYTNGSRNGDALGVGRDSHTTSEKELSQYFDANARRVPGGDAEIGSNAGSVRSVRGSEHSERQYDRISDRGSERGSKVSERRDDVRSDRGSLERFTDVEQDSIKSYHSYRDRRDHTPDRASLKSDRGSRHAPDSQLDRMSDRGSIRSERSQGLGSFDRYSESRPPSGRPTSSTNSQQLEDAESRGSGINLPAVSQRSQDGVRSRNMSPESSYSRSGSVAGARPGSGQEAENRSRSGSQSRHTTPVPSSQPAAEDYSTVSKMHFHYSRLICNLINYCIRL